MKTSTASCCLPPLHHERHSTGDSAPLCLAFQHFLPGYMSLALFCICTAGCRIHQNAQGGRILRRDVHLQRVCMAAAGHLQWPLQGCGTIAACKLWWSLQHLGTYGLLSPCFIHDCTPPVMWKCSSWCEEELWHAEAIIIARDARDAGFTVISMHPGVADTDMGSRPQEVRTACHWDCM